MSDDVRKRAKAKLPPEPGQIDKLSPEQVRQLVHELRRTQEELAAARDRCADLYEFVPVGHLTLNATGIILQANLTAADMLGVPRDRLTGQSLSVFVLPDDQDVWCQRCRVTAERLGLWRADGRVRLTRTDLRAAPPQPRRGLLLGTRRLCPRPGW